MLSFVIVSGISSIQSGQDLVPLMDNKLYFAILNASRQTVGCLGQVIQVFAFLVCDKVFLQCHS